MTDLWNIFHALTLKPIFTVVLKFFAPRQDTEVDNSILLLYMTCIVIYEELI